MYSDGDPVAGCPGYGLALAAAARPVATCSLVERSSPMTLRPRYWPRGMQVDGCAVFERLIRVGSVREAAYLAQTRRTFFDFHQTRGFVVAAEAYVGEFGT